MTDVTDPRDATLRPYALDMPLRWADMDAYGHVNNVQFLRLLEEARIRAIRDWFGHNGLIGTGILVARNEIEYLAPLDYRERPVVVAIWVSEMRGASFELSYEVVDSLDAGAAVYARAVVTLVAYDFDREAPRRLTDVEREALMRVYAEPAPLRRPARAAWVETVEQVETA